MNKEKPLRDYLVFIPELRQVCCVSLGTGDRASYGDNWSPLLPHAILQTQERSEPVNPMAYDFGICKSDTFLHFPGDWNRVRREDN